jgi:hypothetical protein
LQFLQKETLESIIRTAEKLLGLIGLNQNKMKAQLLLFLLLFCYCIHAQKLATRHHHYYRFAFSNSHTAKPFGSFSSLFYKNLHPGTEVSHGKILDSKKNHQWLAEITMSYLWHRWVQHSLALSLNGGYRRIVNDTWGGTVKFGGGYQLSMPTGKVYTIHGGTLKEKINPLRSQFIAALSLGADKKINDKGLSVFMEYQQKIQTPFIKEYVPLLPYNILLVGVTVPFRSSKNRYEK